MAYIGIARHLRHYEWYSAINAFRSPLISWIIAVLTGRNFVLIGKVANISTFLLCAAFLYLLTWRLWKSKLAAGAGLLLYVLGRGFVPAAIGWVEPDFLFSLITLVYFMLLLECLRGATWQTWFYLGDIHAVAYLAKGFALPWLALATLLAVCLSVGSARQRIVRLISAALVPVVVAGAWGLVLHSKYGVFTTGTQLKTNLLQWTLSAYRDHPDPTYTVLRDTTKELDNYFVDDPMPPGSWPWTYHISAAELLPRVLLAEERNLPHVFKEVIILITPGGLFAFAASTMIVMRRRNRYSAEWRFITVIVVSGISLALMYSMLVFDSRYLYPLVPLLLAVAARFLVPDNDWNQNHWKAIAIVLVVLGEITAVAYGASPFRTLTRDFQLSCYDAASRLRAHGGATVVTLGEGPFPEHGVGWEAGYKSTFFADQRLIGALDKLPPEDKTTSTLSDLSKASPDAIMIWGNATDSRYIAFMKTLSLQYPDAPVEEIHDLFNGSVGAILFIRRSQDSVHSHAMLVPQSLQAMTYGWTR